MEAKLVLQTFSGTLLRSLWMNCLTPPMSVPRCPQSRSLLDVGYWEECQAPVSMAAVGPSSSSCTHPES